MNEEDVQRDTEESDEEENQSTRRWRPNFNSWKADLQCNVAAWIRLSDVPFEFYNVESLLRINNMIGKMIKVDRSTSIYDKGGFARICVEIDLKKPLLTMYMNQVTAPEVDQRTEEVGSGGGRDEQPEKLTGDAGGPTIVTGDEASDDNPFGKIRIMRREFCGNLMPADLRKGSH
ncbi:hypothetical protein K1719_033127 [Acacia pycnantha]|nr:hypothetical protein K1719_033127 [Acacia pycnantha]